MSNTWRTTAIVLGLACGWLQWRACNRPAVIKETVADCKPGSTTKTHTYSSSSPSNDDRSSDDSEPPPVAPKAPGTSMFGVTIPSWARSLAPQPGEDLRDYRDRMIPLAQMAVAPQRARLVRGREDFAKVAGLDENQKAALDATAKETATAIQDRLFNAVLSGEISPSTFKPMAGVALARDVLDIVDKGNKRFVGSLTDGQRTKLGSHPFDFGDYLVFSTRWEDAISGL